jgi:hypothetical protein
MSRFIHTLLAFVMLVPTVAPGQAADAPAQAVERERIVLAGALEMHTPAELNQSVAFRYFVPAAPPPTTTLVMIPGLNSGPNTLDILARALVTRGDGLEVWVVPPRATLLQDRRGITASLAEGNPDFALGYYFGGLSIGGHTFHALDQAGMSFAGYWGLDVHLRDIRSVVLEVRRRYPQTNIVLGGHSLGAILAALYAGYDFGRPPGPGPLRTEHGVPAPSPDAGALDLRGMLLIDGVPLGFLPHITPAQYLHGIRFPVHIPGVLALTADDPRQRTEPFTNTADLARPRDDLLFDIIAAYAYLRPEEPSYLPFYPRNALRISNEALLGAILSSEMEPNLFIRATLGTPLGVFRRIPDPAHINPNGLLDLESGSPVPGHTLIEWPADNASPARVNLRELEQAILRPGGDFTQWYLPWRLLVDIGLASQLDTSDAFARQYASLTQVRYTTVPIFVIGAGEGLVRHAGVVDFYRSHIAQSARMIVQIIPGYTHLDLEDAADNPVVPLILRWLNSITRGERTPRDQGNARSPQSPAVHADRQY